MLIGYNVQDTVTNTRLKENRFIRQLDILYKLLNVLCSKILKNILPLSLISTQNKPRNFQLTADINLGTHKTE